MIGPTDAPTLQTNSIDVTVHHQIELAGLRGQSSSLFPSYATSSTAPLPSGSFVS